MTLDERELCALGERELDRRMRGAKRHHDDLNGPFLMARDLESKCVGAQAAVELEKVSIGLDRVDGRR